MTPRELKRMLRQRRKELRRGLPALRRRAKARVDEIPAVQKERRRRRLRRVLMLAVIVLLACLVRCDCQPPALPPIEVTEPAPQPDAGVEVKKKPAVAAPARRRRVEAKVEAQPRNAFGSGARPPPSWLDEFRLQVAARSPRLAECFTGRDRPGALRWTTSLNPESGTAADHELEPIGPHSDVSADQRECVLKVLSDPKYRIAEGAKESLPERVSLVIEF